MLYRTAEKKISEWIKKGDNALLVSGARQVGKTYSIRRCLKENKVDYLEINLIESPGYIDVLGKSTTVDDLVTNISVLSDHRFVKGETVLFIDEVQEYKDVVTKVKFWVDDGSYRYIFSGSLLGVELRDLRSAPVGYLGEIQMYPMDFQEFIIACGGTDETISLLSKCIETGEKLTDAVHEKMMESFRRYMVVGGMPAAVQAFVDSGNLNDVSEVQKNIISLYRRDYTKYEQQRKKLMLEKIYDLIPSELLKQNRRFNFADIKKGLRFERVEDSFIWLEKAGVVISAYNTSEPRIALKQNKKSSLVKLYLSDVGLLTCMYGDSMKYSIIMDEQSINTGGLYENAVVQQLATHGFDTYYYNSRKLGELDFIIEKDGRALPIEVKSGKDYYVHSAINNVLSTSEFGIEKAVVFTNYNLSDEGNVKYYPIYLSAFFYNSMTLPSINPMMDYSDGNTLGGIIS